MDIFGSSSVLNFAGVQSCVADQEFRASFLSALEQPRDAALPASGTKPTKPEDHLQPKQHISAHTPMCDKVYKITPPHTTMLHPNRHLNHGCQSFSLMNHHLGTAKSYGIIQSSSTARRAILSPLKNRPPFPNEALLGLYIPKTERQGAGITKKTTCPGRWHIELRC
ncbi:hypothetical protein EVAR_67839_1 [Eumeta japonica]|uniref:Uncharacterized protein n=1 Tax=Eumeta variegata TaxID=151549 RepID=A0A4C1ZW78_EUMVA|nr:hypothetical protein EVAR_67839_1 [Eumeta japonica]